MQKLALAILALFMAGVGAQAMTERPVPLVDDPVSDVDPSDAEPMLEPNQPDLEMDTTFAAAQREFGQALLAAVAAENPNTNVLVSPASVTVALGMLLNGAAGDTYTELASVLGVSDLAAFNATAGRLEGSANSLWLAEGFPVLDRFRETIATDYGALIETVNFSAAATTDQINDWVAEQTRDRIPTIVDQVDPATEALLINAIYFKDNWATQFDPERTQPTDFTLADNSTTSVSMMRGKQSVPYAEAEGYQLVELAYENDALSMVLVLPDEVTTLTDFLATVTLADIETTLSTSLVEAVNIGLPRFTVDFNTSLNRPLQALGIRQIFGGADFSNLADVPLSVSDTIHKTFIQVDEEGTEAAAVTGISVTRVMVEELSVTFDRPFLYLLRDRDSGAPVFTGWLADPPAPVQ